MYKFFTKCPVCKSNKDLSASENTAGTIMCSKETSYSTHFRMQTPHYVYHAPSQQDKRQYEGFVFGNYQIFFIDNEFVEIYDLPRAGNPAVISINNATLQYKDINSAKKLDSFVKNYKML